MFSGQPPPPSFSAFSSSLSLSRARTRARVCRPRDGSGLEGPRTENSSRAERPRACAARKKEEVRGGGGGGGRRMRVREVEREDERFLSLDGIWMLDGGR